MSDKMRWRYGDTNPVIAAADSATVIEIGDLVWQDTDDAKPASSMAWDTSLAKTQDNLADTFLGVAMQRSRSGDAVPVRVATSGVFEFDCDAATFELGDLVGPAKAAGNALLPQKVVKVTDPAYAIGRVAKRAATATTAVLVDMQSVVMYGGLRGATAAAG